MYNFALLDPRLIPAAQEANEKIFSSPCGVCLHSSGQLDGETCRYCGGTGFAPVYGIEVTMLALAKRCVLNLDPQHLGGNANRAAIEDALIIELPAEGSTLATVRADLDAVGAMAVLVMRSEGIDLTQTMERINLIAESDKFARGGWQGVKPLPTTKHLYDDSTASTETDTRLAPIAAAVGDFKVPIADRMEKLKKWLLTGEEPAGYREKFIANRKALANAITDGMIKAESVNGKIAKVISTHRAATSIGYCLAPVVVALNPSFSFQGSPAHAKFTVCQFTPGYVDMKAALAELNELESGWGGSPTIGGSPQGVSSTLTIDKVAEVVAKHLLR